MFVLSQNTSSSRDEKYIFMNINCEIWIHLPFRRKMWLHACLFLAAWVHLLLLILYQSFSWAIIYHRECFCFRFEKFVERISMHDLACNFALSLFQTMSLVALRPDRVGVGVELYRANANMSANSLQRCHFLCSNFFIACTG